jgi:hypothetical protein
MLVSVAALISVSPAAATGEPGDLDVKRIWNTLTPDERAAYRAVLAERDRFGSVAPGALLTPGATCGESTPELEGLPIEELGDTSGQPDSYRYGVLCGAGFNAESGVGPDLAYQVVLDRDCEIDVVLTPDTFVDLALYVMTDCDDVDAGCVAGRDQGSQGGQEQVSFSAVADTPYFIVVDGFLGDSGEFALAVLDSADAGCGLVPVELLGFDVE